jgi:hypothetical protein
LLLGLASLPLLPLPAAAAALEQQSADIAQLQVGKGDARTQKKNSRPLNSCLKTKTELCL